MGSARYWVAVVSEEAGSGTGRIRRTRFGGAPVRLESCGLSSKRVIELYSLFWLARVAASRSPEPPLLEAGATRGGRDGVAARLLSFAAMRKQWDA